ncbi:MAG TPA: 3-phosphoshikimate 1-carboxyvinyltransferase [Legionellaceae bacterium]|nr:3-phosphoshikimate 1-carboxyvinyltransferase [Legionellaceae bacterium]
MMYYRIQASNLCGSLVIPPSKSHTLRAILFASMADGKSIIRNYLTSPDTQAMLCACKQLGADITVQADALLIHGCAGSPKTPDNIIDAGNSGQVLRFIAAIAALTDGYTVLTGDHSIRTNRPIQALLTGLNALNVWAVSTQNNGFAPMIIKGPLLGGETTLNGADSQPVSALLMAAAFAKYPTVIHVDRPGEKPWVDLTLDWLKRMGIMYQRQGYTQYQLFGNARYAGFEYTVPGDFSSCAFPTIAALITNSTLELHGLDKDDVQGDKILLDVLESCGAQLQWDQSKKIVTIHPSGTLCGQTIDVNHFIDAVPILTVMACFMSGETKLTGAGIARHKECDRLAIITQELRKMGADITEEAEGLRIRPAVLKGAMVSSAQDHRIAMALAIAALRAEGETIIKEVACVEKSYPGFAQSMQKIGAYIELVV